MNRRLIMALLAAACAACGSSSDDDGAPLPPAPSADAGPVRGGDVLTFDEIVQSPADGSQTDPAVAWTGTSYLVVWADQNDGLRARRVGTDGTALDPIPLTIANGNDLRDPRVVCAAGTCAVTWLDVFADGSPRRLARFLADGAPVDAEPLTIASTPGSIGALADGFVLSWADSGRVLATRLGLTGPPVDDPAIVVFTDAMPQELQGGLRVGCSDTSCLVAFGVCPQGLACQVGTARLGADGAVSPAQRLSAPVLLTDVAAGGGEFLIVGSDGQTNVLGVRVGADGSPIDATAFTIFNGGSGQSGAFDGASAAFDGESFLVTTHLQGIGTIDGKVIGKRVATDGQTSPALPFDLTPSIDQQGRVAAACGPGQCLSAATVREDAPNIDVFYTRVAGVNALDAGGALLTVSANRQWFPTAASNGQDYLVVWEDTREDGGTIRAARLSAAGEWLDSTSVELGRLRFAQSYPSVAWNGSVYQVVWTSPQEGVRTARVSGDGALLDPEPVVIDAVDAPMSRIGCGGGVCLVPVVREGRQVIWRLGPDGKPLDAAPIELGESGNGDPRGSVAYRDGIFAVTWTPPDPMAYGAIVCTRLTVDGVLVDDSPVRLATGGQGMMVVATDDDFVAVWTGDFGPLMDDLDVGFAILGGAGGVLADGTLTATASNEVGSAPVFGGHDVFVPWQEYDVSARTGRIAMRRVHPSGTVLDAEPFEVAEVWPVTGIASASTGHGDALVVWDDIDHSPDIAATRLRMRLLHEDVSP